MDIANLLLKSCDVNTKPLEVITKGIELLKNHPVYDNKTRKLLLIEIIKMYSAGCDGVMGTADDRLSENTVAVLSVMIENDMLGYVIDGIVKGTKKIKIKCGCFG
jgi:hypothetical protein